MKLSFVLLLALVINIFDAKGDEGAKFVKGGADTTDTDFSTKSMGYIVPRGVGKLLTAGSLCQSPFAKAEDPGGTSDGGPPRGPGSCVALLLA